MEKHAGGDTRPQGHHGSIAACPVSGARPVARLVSKIFWSILAVIIPVIGPIMAMGFGRVPRPHGESTPPTRSWMGDSWTGGWR